MLVQARKAVLESGDWLTAADLDLPASQARLFYLGYLMLLDALDATGPDGDFRLYRSLSQKFGTDRPGLMKALKKEAVVRLATRAHEWIRMR